MMNKQVILHVDDDEANRYAVRLILDKAGYEVREAATGEEGLKLSHQNPDLIVLDIKLPDINGYEVCRQIKADPQTSNIPILQTSANFTEAQHKVEGLESGADGYLAQPIEAAVLVATVRSLLRVRMAEKAAQQAISAREEMLAIVSHDLRNPLSAVMLQAKLMAKSYEKHGQVPDLLDKLEKVSRACNRMNRLIQDILDVTSLEGGKFKLIQNLFPAPALIHDIYSSVEELARSSGIEVNCEMPDESLMIFGDRERLLQVLMNLVGNSLKFTPQGGFINLIAKDTKEGVLIEVADSGGGIGPEALAHIFNRFWQGHKANGVQGIGLGLSIVKGIIDAHHGKIWVESELKKGTKFSILLPKNNA